jgi:hypothetical protein
MKKAPHPPTRSAANKEMGALKILKNSGKPELPFFQLPNRSHMGEPKTMTPKMKHAA